MMRGTAEPLFDLTPKARRFLVEYDEISDWPVWDDYTRPPASDQRKQNRAAHNMKAPEFYNTRRIYNRLMPSRSGYRGIKVLKKS